MDFTLFYEKYEALAKAADAAFETIRKGHGDCVTCRTGCADCCHALFDLTLVEAMYINDRFRRRYSGEALDRLIEKAATADRKLAKIKRKAYKRVQEGVDDSVILEEMAAVRMRCPLLDDSDQCALYEFRPITCRLYGVPTSINGQAHTCGLTGFDQGQAYPTVKLEVIQGKLFSLSGELVRAIGSKYTQMASLLVPLSMALITDYTDDYLGISVMQTVPVDPEGGGRHG
ncbi:MAG: YkgJ family cysteine cluster protein [Desulfobacterales bacterium]|nr:YkgJ family cysteine cluster protein [Desulfobacterales bacterium]